MSVGDLVEYSKVLHFVVAVLDEHIVKICPVNKIDLFGTDRDRLQTIVKYSFSVHRDGLKLNETGRLEDESR
jgi:hypothetical protein